MGKDKMIPTPGWVKPIDKSSFFAVAGGGGGGKGASSSSSSGAGSSSASALFAAAAAAAAVPPKVVEPFTAEELKEREERKKREDLERANANLKRATARAEQKDDRPRDAVDLNSKTVDGWMKEHPEWKEWLDRKSPDVIRLANEGHVRCGFSGKCGEKLFALTKQALLQHAKSSSHVAHLAAVSSTASGEHDASVESSVFIASATDSIGSEASLKEKISALRKIAAGYWVASGMRP
jgi:hypothetical protein